MFLGSDEVNMDAKGRMPIPARYRDELMSEYGGNLVVTINPSDTALSVYLPPAWEEVEEAIARMPSFKQSTRDFQHLLLGNARRLELDSSGRVLIPPKLRALGELGKGVTLVGQSHRLEIWDTERWDIHHKELCDAMANGLETSEEMQAIPL